MFQVLERSKGKVIGLKLSGKLLHADYQQFVPKLDALIKQYGSARCLIEMNEFSGVEPRAIWDELKFDTTHCMKIERCSIVGDKTWEKWATNLSKPMFPSAHMKFFAPDQMEQAWQYVEEGA